MINSLISNKFHIPLTWGRLTLRLCLEESLLDGCRLALASAWIQKQAVGYAWLSLDQGDNILRLLLLTREDLSLSVSRSRVRRQVIEFEFN